MVNIKSRVGKCSRPACTPPSDPYVTVSRHTALQGLSFWCLLCCGWHRAGLTSPPGPRSINIGPWTDLARSLRVTRWSGYLVDSSLTAEGRLLARPVVSVAGWFSPFSRTPSPWPPSLSLSPPVLWWSPSPWQPNPSPLLL